MTYNYTPGHRPTVVFISQRGNGGADWQPVIERLTSASATFTYDRPGTGNALPRPAPNPAITYSTHAAELDRYLTVAGVQGPLVLVGHSVGSLIARVFAGCNTQRTAGIVYVDGSIPRMNLSGGLEDPFTGGGTEVDLLAGEIEVLDAGVPQVPTVVLTRTPGRWDVALPRPEIDDLWSAYQRQLAQLADGHLVVAENAGHQMTREAPDLVAYAVDAVVQAARRAGPVELDPQILTVVGASQVA
ncbi:MAG TPA: alpha/beta fold hydrolase [Candidatus Dormibacteraeota bacterium]